MRREMKNWRGSWRLMLSENRQYLNKFENKMNLMKTLLLLFFLFAAYSADATRKEMLIGKWVYSRAEFKTEIDDKAKSMMDMVFEGAFYYFKANGHFKARVMDNVSEGDWQLSADENTIITMNYKGGTEQVPIVSVSDTSLLIAVEEMVVYFRKTLPDAEDEVEMTKHLSNVTATMEQVARKWKIMRMDDADKDAEKDPKIKEATSQLMQDSN